jgi:hypothetical protein
MLVGELQRKDHFGGLEVQWRIILKCALDISIRKCDVNSSESEQDPTSYLNEHCVES